LAQNKLTNSEFETLRNMKKGFEDNDPIIIPDQGGKINRTLQSKISEERFLLQIERGRINLKKVKYQAMYQATVLLRIDLTGPRHCNPDGEFIECPHIHIYSEKYGDKWAYPLENFISYEDENLSTLLQNFLVYFNVEEIPRILSVEKLI
jgi:hypothetical protein